MGENQSSFIAHLRDQSDGLRTRLTSGDITIQDIQDFMHVTAVMWNPEYFETEKQENEAVIVALFDRIKNRLQAESGKLSFSREEELIVDLFFKHMLKEDLYSASRSAVELINRSANARVELSAHWIGFYYAEQSGELEQAINHLDRVMELERKHGVSEKILSDMYDMYSSLLFNRYEGIDAMYRHPDADMNFSDVNNVVDSTVGVSIYPNPFNPVATMRLTIEEESNVYIEVYNTIGQKVATLSNNTLLSGSHTFRFDGTNLASGVYIIKTQIGGNASIQRITLLK